MQKKPRSATIALIGETAEITEAKNKTLVGVKGRIIDETKSTITIQDGKKTKKIIKEQIKITINGKTTDGKNLIGRPETRIKQ
ncbi:ribonuclease P protein subunit [archaeon]|nr:ribonuclease P protein subunit [archaeon]